MTVVALGESQELEGFALAGALVVPAETDDAMIAAFDELEDDTALIILTNRSARVLQPRLGRRTHLLTVVLP